jgi:hypothetical protein
MLSKFNLDVRLSACEIRNVASKVVRRVRVRSSPPPVTILPLLDDMRHRVLAWVDEIEEHGPAKVLSSVEAARNRLLRVHGSIRHQRFAEFLQHCVVALENEQAESARYILLTAMAALGWPTPPEPHS